MNCRLRKNQYTSREATLLGWTMFTLRGKTNKELGIIQDWLEENIEGRWAVAGFNDYKSDKGVNICFENEDDGVYTRLVW